MTLSFMPSCTTDSYGNSSVTPGGAAAIGVGALAAGAAIGAAVQHDRTRTGTAMTGATIILLLRLPVRLIAPNGGGKKGACV